MLNKNKKVILNHYTFPTKQVNFEELQKFSRHWQVPFFTFKSIEQGCGDVLHLLVKKEGGVLRKMSFFSFSIVLDYSCGG